MKFLKTILSLACVLMFISLESSVLGGVSFQTLISFSGTNGPNWGSTWGTGRTAAMVQAGDGNLYGAAQMGGYTPSGDWAGFGTAFRITPDGSFGVLHYFGTVTNSFDFAMDGYWPLGDLTVGADGNIYGTVAESGATSQTTYPNGYGVAGGAVFQITPSGTYSILHAFADDAVYDSSVSSYVAACGIYPYAGVTQGRDGNFYGTTTRGGHLGRGAIFMVDPSGASTLLYQFPTNYSPGGVISGLIQGDDGAFYGTTQYGGDYSLGSVFRFVPGVSFTTLYSFNAGAPATNGIEPISNLCKGSDGNLYGTTSTAIPSLNAGTIFRISTNGLLTTLHAFSGDINDGGTPEGGLIQGSDGNLYGTTYGGGADNYYGTVYQLTLDGKFTLLHSFRAPSNGLNADGMHPTATLVQASNGSFYGTTSGAGAYGYGTIFRLTVTPDAPMIQGMATTNGTVSFSWNAGIGSIYQVQFTTNFLTGSWTNLGVTNTATQSTMSASDSIGTDAQRFYRVVLVR